jgi:hypothetical protein
MLQLLLLQLEVQRHYEKRHVCKVTWFVNVDLSWKLLPSRWAHT